MTHLLFTNVVRKIDMATPAWPRIWLPGQGCWLLGIFKKKKSTLWGSTM